MTTILHGCALEQLATLPAESVDCVVTDPPYELGFMGKAWDRSGIAFSVPLWQAVYRVLKPGGHVLAFGGSRTYHRMTSSIEDAGFDIRDQLMWVYGSGFPKSHNLEGEWDGWGTALKPAHEPICMARKPLAGTVLENVLQHGTGAIHIDACRVNEAVEGRWPANFIHDGSPEVEGLFPHSTSGAMRADTARAAQDRPGSVCFGTYGGNITSSDIAASSGSAARFFYCPKVSTSERNEGCGHLPNQDWAQENVPQPEREKRPFKPSKNNHPTVKPIALMRWLCRLIAPPGGVVLDPFMGSGSTGVAAIHEGFGFIGIDKTAEWHPIAEARLKHALEMKNVAESQPLLNL